MNFNMQRKLQGINIAIEILEEIKKQQKVNEKKRELCISDQSLNAMFESVSALMASIKKNQFPSKKMRYRTLSRMIIDSWPLNTKLGNEICKLEDLYDTFE